MNPSTITTAVISSVIPTDPPKLTGIGTGSMVGRGERATAPSQQVTAFAKKLGI
jgi:hypothetical protein